VGDEFVPATTAAPQWRAAPRQQLTWADLEGEFAVYHRPSGKTHFLNAASAQLIQEVLVAPRTARSAAASLAGGEAQRDYVELVTGLLLRLEELGLVARCPP
jgi:PqqD family protein of HPr-rel-A system